MAQPPLFSPASFANSGETSQNASGYSPESHVSHRDMPPAVGGVPSTGTSSAGTENVDHCTADGTDCLFAEPLHARLIALFPVQRILVIDPWCS